MSRLILVLLLVLLAAACGDITVRAICRGDSVSTAGCDTCLVSCAVIEDTTRRAP